MWKESVELWSYEAEVAQMTNEERFKEIYQTQITREGAAELLSWIDSTDFFTAPAGAKHHGACPGGLVAHSLNVYYALIDGPYARNFTTETRAICALLHDLCKIDFYHKQADGSYTVKDHFPFGHGEKSAFLIQRYMKPVSYTHLRRSCPRPPGRRRSSGLQRGCAGRCGSGA